MLSLGLKSSTGMLQSKSLGDDLVKKYRMSGNFRGC